MGRTNIVLDDELLAEAMKATGLKTKKATVEEGLRRLTQTSRLTALIERTRGMGWSDGSERPGARALNEEAEPFKGKE